MKAKLSIRDRKESIVTTDFERDISKDNWPFAITEPAPPFALGRVVALVTTKGQADRIVRACNSHKALMEALDLLVKQFRCVDPLYSKDLVVITKAEAALAAAREEV